MARPKLDDPTVSIAFRMKRSASEWWTARAKSMGMTLPKLQFKYLRIGFIVPNGLDAKERMLTEPTEFATSTEPRFRFTAPRRPGFVGRRTAEASQAVAHVNEAGLADPCAALALLSRYDREHSCDMGTEFVHEVAQEGCSRVVGDLTVVGEHLG
jgi:hypothetical protein